MMLCNLRIKPKIHSSYIGNWQFVVNSKTNKWNLSGLEKITQKQSIRWAAAPIGHQIILNKLGKKLFLKVRDFHGNEPQFASEIKSLPVKNLDIQELIIPKKCLCRAANEWLSKIGNRLIVQIQMPDSQNIRLGLELFVGMSPEYKIWGITLKKSKPYGILFLNS